MPDRSWILSGWAALRDKAPAVPSHMQEVADLRVQTGFGTARLAIDNAGLPQALLPVASGVKLPISDGPPLLRPIINRLADREGSRPYLVVTCLDPGLERAFADLIESVLWRIEGGDSSLAAYSSAVDEFRALFSQGTQGRVDEWRIRGLVAELLELERLVALAPGAVGLWFGPESDRHDFRGGVNAIEVKSTRRHDGKVTISGLGQLVPPAGGELLLSRYILEPSPGGSLSIGGIYAKLLAAGAFADDLLVRLRGMGCLEPLGPEWNRVSFNLEGCDTFRVIDDFPRLIPASFSDGVPPGVSDVIYEIDLAHAAHFQVGETELQAFEKELIAGLDR